MPEQIRKTVEQLEDIFIQAVPVEAARPPKLQAQGNRTVATKYRVPVNEEEEKRDNMSLTGQDGGLMVSIKWTVHLPPDRLAISVACITAVISNQTTLL